MQRDLQTVWTLIRLLLSDDRNPKHYLVCTACLKSFKEIWHQSSNAGSINWQVQVPLWCQLFRLLGLNNSVHISDCSMYERLSILKYYSTVAEALYSNLRITTAHFQVVKIFNRNLIVRVFQIVTRRY